jgi:hypothetical protein
MRLKQGNPNDEPLIHHINAEELLILAVIHVYHQLKHISANELTVAAFEDLGQLVIDCGLDFGVGIGIW